MSQIPTQKNEILERYYQELKSLYETKATKELSFRTPLENLLKALKPSPSYTIIQEAKSEGKSGAKPDFDVYQKIDKQDELSYNRLIGFVECKDIDKDLDFESEQIKRYLEISPNIILTNYRRFMLLSFGKVIYEASLFDESLNTHLFTQENKEEFFALISAFFADTNTQIKSKAELVKVLSSQSFYLSIALKNAKDDKSDKEQNALFNEFWQKTYDTFKSIQKIDFSEIDFCDTIAQSIVYGLFVSFIENDKLEIEKIDTHSFIELLPNHFKTLHEFIYFSLPAFALPKRVLYVLNNVKKTLALLDKASMAKFLDLEIEKIAIYLYEDFLKEYDELRSTQKRKQGGVFYTPEPVVNMIVSCLDELLQRKFDKPKGFLDSEVKVLDFATGTGSFLATVFEKIISKERQAFRNDTIKHKFLKDIYGFEISFVAYIVARLKLGQILKNAGFSDFNDANFPIYLNNTLDLSENANFTMSMPLLNLDNEWKKARDIKHNKNLLVILGNPPYNVKSTNKDNKILELLQTYKQGLNETKINLDDDYIKFIRFAQWKLLEQKQQQGIMGFITNNSFLDGRTHRKMRESLAKSFDEIYILNLNGDSTEDKNDKNVFDIRVGVCISLFVKYRESTIHCHTDAAFCHTELSQESEVSKNHINCHTNATFCHTEGEARSISKHSFFRNAQNRDISAFSKPQYDKDRDSSLVSLTQNDKVGNPSLRVGEAIHSTPSLRDLPKASRGNPLRSKETYKNTQLAKERDCHESATFNKVVDSRNDNKISPSLAREESESSPSLAEGDKGGGYESLATIHYFSTKDNEILRRADKFALLNDIAHNGLDSIKWQNLTLDSPYFWFVPKDLSNAEYENFWALATNKALGESKAIFEIFNSGVDTNVDKYGFVYGFNANQIYNTIDNFTKMTPQDLRLHYKINDTKSRDWKVEWAKADIVANVDCHESANADAGIASNSRNDELPTPSLRGSEATEAIQNKIHKIAYRPFDLRYTFYTGTQCGFMANPRKKVLSNLLESDNIGMCFTKDSNIADNFLVSPYIIDSHLLAGKAHIAPLYCYDSNLNQQSKVVNFTRAFSEYKTKHKVLKDKSPEQILAFIYGNLYNPNYRAKYIEYLKIGFPRIDFEVSQSHFEKIATLGQNLIDLHLMKNIPSDKTIDLRFRENANKSNPNFVLEKPKYEPNQQKIVLNSDLEIVGIAQEVWDYTIGGYKVLDKWLKYRVDYQCNQNELTHILNVAKILKATISLQAQLAQI